MEALEKQIQQICSLYFEDWQPQQVKRTIEERFLDAASEFFFLFGYVFLLYFFILVIKGEEGLLMLTLSAVFFVFRILIEYFLQRKRETKRTDKEGLINKELSETIIHLTIIDKQNPLKEDEEVLIITLANLSVLTPTTRRDEMVSSLLEEATRTRLIKLSLFKALCQKFQVEIKPAF